MDRTMTVEIRIAFRATPSEPPFHMAVRDAIDVFHGASEEASSEMIIDLESRLRDAVIDWVGAHA